MLGILPSCRFGTRTSARIAAVAAALGVLCASASANAAVPATAQVEGVLATSSGGAVADGDYEMIFALYKDAEGGSAVWTEGPVATAVLNGAFSHELGTASPLTQDVLTALTGKGYLSLQVGSDPELTRKPLRSALFAMRTATAEALDCSGCVGTGQMDAAVLAPYAKTAALDAYTKTADLAKVATTGKYADLDGGPDLSAYVKAASLATVALSGAYADLTDIPDLAVYAKTADLAKVATTGQYADLDGAPTLAKLDATCGTGLVVRGLKADGSYECVVAMDPAALPKDGLDEISNGLLFNQFDEVATSAKTPVAILDNNPVGISDLIDVPDFGVAQTLTISAHVANSDTSNLVINVIDPTSTKFVLWSKTTEGTAVKTTWPTDTKTVSGDLTTWVGKNPKGKWYIEVIDTGFLNNGIDGEIVTWSVNVQTLSDKKVQVNGDLVVTGALLGNAAIPKGAVMPFNLTVCPVGWTELVAARGRYIVGLQEGGAVASTIGNPLANNENRAIGQHSHTASQAAHTHGYNRPEGTVPGRCCGYTAYAAYLVDATTAAVAPAVSVADAGTVAGTPAPYMQLLMCTKN
jgi:subtilisin-like proprotein convertase family protein